jgi:hypothetical protein
MPFRAPKQPEEVSVSGKSGLTAVDQFYRVSRYGLRGVRGGSDRWGSKIEQENEHDNEDD